jgi:tight adherence protein B
MGLVIGVAIAVWVGSAVVWYMLSNAFKTADADKIKSRVIGVGAKQTKKPGAKSPALFTPDELPQGRVVMHLLRRFRWNEKLREMIEQAGLRWNVARTVHGCLALFLGGYFLSSMLLPAGFQQLAWLVAPVCGMLPLTYIRKKRSARLRKFEEIFPESLEFVARSMRAGHAF